jgi:hypothetical protein
MAKVVKKFCSSKQEQLAMTVLKSSSHEQAQPCKHAIEFKLWNFTNYYAIINAHHISNKNIQLPKN